MQKSFKNPLIISSNLIENEANQVQKYFDKLKAIVKLPTYWSKENFIELELKKSFIRGLLRYSEKSNSLLSNILSAIKKENFLNLNFKWSTNVYPMIHLSNDKAEAVGFHYDAAVKNELITCWVPITDYKYPSLSFINNSENYSKLFSKIVLFSPLSKILSKKMYIKKGSASLWDGRLIHAGNFNFSNEVSCAFQFKLTTDPYGREQSFKANVIKNINGQNFTFDNFDIDKDFKLYDKLIKLIIENESLVKLNDEKKICFVGEIVRDNFSGKNLPLSFATSVLAQRILTSKKFLKNYAFFKNCVKILDIFSLYLGAENLISLERIIDKIKKNEVQNFLKKLKENDSMSMIDFKSDFFTKYTN